MLELSLIVKNLCVLFKINKWNKITSPWYCVSINMHLYVRLLKHYALMLMHILINCATYADNIKYNASVYQCLVIDVNVMSNKCYYFMSI